MSEITRVDGPAAIQHPALSGAVFPPPMPKAAQPGPISVAPEKPQVLGRPGAIDLVLPDGRTVHMDRPNVACQFMVYRILGGVLTDGSAPQTGLGITVKALMYVVSIGGVAVTRPTNHVEAQALMNDLGDDGTEMVAGTYLQHFLLQRAELPLSDR